MSIGEMASTRLVTTVRSVDAPSVATVANATPVLLAAAPYKNRMLPSFTTHDLAVQYSGCKNLDRTISVLNVFNTIAPRDVD